MLTAYNLSLTGQSHIEEGLPCQDYSAFEKVELENESFIVAAISDGVGSCQFSDEGAETAVRTYIDSVSRQLKEVDFSDTELNKDLLMEDLIKSSFEEALENIETHATAEEKPFLLFDCTLTGVIYDQKGQLFYGHIGDDGIVAMFKEGNYKMITQRHCGKYIGEVHPLRHTNFWEFGSCTDVAAGVLMTDGLLNLIAPDGKVFFPMLEGPLTRVVEQCDIDYEKTSWFEFLKSGELRERVTDDITFLPFQSTELVKELPDVSFDEDKWEREIRAKKSAIQNNNPSEKYLNEDTLKNGEKSFKNICNAEDAHRLSSRIGELPHVSKLIESVCKDIKKLIEHRFLS